LNTKSENNTNEHVGRPIMLHWHWIHAQKPSVVFTNLCTIKISPYVRYTTLTTSPAMEAMLRENSWAIASEDVKLYPRAGVGNLWLASQVWLLWWWHLACLIFY